MKKYKKYNVNLKVLIPNIIIVVLLFVSFLVFLSITNIQTIDSLGAKTYNMLVLLKEASIVGLTIFGGSIISILIIEIGSKNNEHFSNIVNDVVCDPRVLEIMSDKNKKILSKNLLGLQYDSQTEMIESVINKLNEFDYYYEESNVSVTCEVSGDTCKKLIQKHLKLKSFSRSFTVEKYRIVASSTKENDSDFLKIKSIKLNRVKLDENSEYSIRDEIVTEDEKNALKQGYKRRYICELIKPLELNDEKAVILEIEYETNVKKDFSFTSRLPCPCKKYIFSFCLLSKNKQFEISGSAFGFMDRGDYAPNIYPNSLNFKFDSWCFKDDGVSLSYKEKK